MTVPAVPEIRAGPSPTTPAKSVATPPGQMLVQLGAVPHVAGAGHDAFEPETVAAARCEAEVDPLRRECAGNGGADSPARACDDRHLSCQTHRTSFNAG